MIQPLESFHKNRYRRNGYSATCKACSSEMQHLKHQGKRGGSIHEKVIDPKRRDACVTMRVHHKEMKDDPEHLSTEFIQTVIGRKCQ